MFGYFNRKDKDDEHQIRQDDFKKYPKENVSDMSNAVKQKRELEKAMENIEG